MVVGGGVLAGGDSEKTAFPSSEGDVEMGPLPMSVISKVAQTWNLWILDGFLNPDRLYVLHRKYLVPLLMSHLL